MSSTNKLYKMLYEDYKLEKNVDFWLHPQSGSYIITHNAVKKIVAKQSDKGFTIQTPMAKDMIVFKNGSEGGIHGDEVVLGGDFHLKNKDGKIVRSVFRIGEANSKNCKIAYPFTMAEKRLYDRGVLDLLHMAQEGAYSDIEADDFKKKPGKEKVLASTQPKVAAPQRPPMPEIKKAEAPRITAPENKAPAPPLPTPRFPEVKKVEEDLGPQILKLLESKTEGVSKSFLWDHIDQDKEKIDTVIETLLQSGNLYKTGERRGTKYCFQNFEKVPVVEDEQEVESIGSLSKTDYNTFWREASEELRAKGLEYNQIMGIVREVTGFDSAVKAYNSGSFTKEHIETISKMGTQLGA